MSNQKMHSNAVNRPTQCPFCGNYFDHVTYPEIHIPGDSKLKKKVLNKTLFFPTCPYCKKEIKLKPNCMYRDDNRREWIVATEKRDTAIEDMMKSGDLRLNDISTEDDVVDLMKGLYKRRVVHDVDSFREKILLSDNNYDDRIIELMKLSLSKLLERENHVPVYRIFLEETAGNQLEFIAIMGSHAPFEYVSVKSTASAYTYYRDKYIDKLGRPEEDEYILTDQKWAVRSGLLEDEDAGFVIPY